MKNLFKYTYLLALLVLTSTNAWAEYYVLNDATERSISPSLVGKHVEYNYTINGPGAILTFEAKRSAKTAVGNLKVAQYVNETWTDVYDKYPGTTYEQSGKIEIDRHATKLSFYNDYGSYTRYFKNVKVTMASYIDDPASSSLNFGTVQQTAGETTLSTTIDWSNVSAMSPSISGTNADLFSATITNNSSAGNYGTATISVKYLHSENGNHSATLTVGGKTISLSGTTVGKVATSVNYIGAESYNWNNENVSATDIFVVRDANTTAVPGALVTLTSDNSGVISIENGNTLVFGHCAGTANITATYAETTDYKGSTTTKAITVNKTPDEISFSDDAKSVIVVGDEYEANWASATSASAITYTSSNPAVLKIENGQIIAVAKGEVTLTATSTGTCQYSSISEQMAIHVRLSTDPCESPLLEKSSVKQFSQTDDNDDYVIAVGPRDKLTYQWKKLTAITIDATNKLWGFDAATNQWRELKTLSTPKTSWVNDEYTFTDADQNITKIKWTSSFEDGSKFVQLVKVSQRSYLTPSTTTLSMPAIKLCETASAEMTINYSDLSRILLTEVPAGLTYEVYKGETKLDDFDNDCGDFGTFKLKIFYTPTEVGTYSKTFKLSASGKESTITFAGNVTPADRTIVWGIPSGNEIYATQSVDLNAYAHTACVTPAGTIYYTASPADAVTIEGNHVTFLREATVTITAHTNSAAQYADAATVDRVWNVKKCGVKMTTLPTITSPITYGDNSSVVTWANDWIAVDVLNDQVLAGVINYVGPLVFNAAGDQVLTFNFTPTNLNTFNAIQFTVPVTVNKAVSVASATASAITYGQKVSESLLSNEGTPGTWAWADAIQNETPEVGDHAYQAVFTPTDANYTTLTTDVSLTVNPQPEYIFEEDGDWSNGANWNIGSVPGNVPVIINANVTINSDVTVSSLTINSGAQVTLDVHGKLTIGDEDSKAQASYGDLIVRGGGQVVLGEGELNVNNFYILSDYVSSDQAKSGHLDNPNKIDVQGDAYMQLSLDKSGRAQYGWYAFSVPFAVNLSDGIFAIRSEVKTPIKNGVDFKIQRYDEARRAAGQYGWVRENASLQPGKMYLITVDDEVQQDTLLFRAANKSLQATTEIALEVSAGEETNRGWNGIGNSTFGYVNLPAGTKLQIYNFEGQCYDQREANEVSLVVGSAAFVQAKAAGNITLTETHTPGTLRAPMREAATIDECRIKLLSEEGEELDRLYISASEEASDSYTIGHDLLKMGASTRKAQLWCSAYGDQLCDAELPLLSGRASFPLTFFSPAEGNYTLTADALPEDATLYLTSNNRVIWNLSMADYDLSLTAGQEHNYGLLLLYTPQAGITTSLDAAIETTNARKVLIDNIIYIVLPDGSMRDMQGKMIK